MKRNLLKLLTVASVVATLTGCGSSGCSGSGCASTTTPPPVITPTPVPVVTPTPVPVVTPTPVPVVTPTPVPTPAGVGSPGKDDILP